MTWLRALVLASFLGVLALAACGGAGSGGAGGPSTAPATSAPALGTNNPATPTPSGDPYSEGY
jgi:hypothetical protein